MNNTKQQVSNRNGKLLQYESENNKSRWKKIALNDSNFVIIVQIDLPWISNLYQFECERVVALAELFERDEERTRDRSGVVAN